MLQLPGMRIAIQGVAASFHDTAARQWFGDDIETVPGESFSEVFARLARHEADAAVVAMENSLYGSIHQVYDLLETYRYPIIGEIHLPINQQLITKHDTGLITKIYSHPVALAQCEQYLDVNYPEAERIEYHDTAAAVEFIKQQSQTGLAAIASREAAKLHGMPIRAENIEDNKANFTRFLVIQPGGTAPTDANRTSLVLTTDHTPGALAKILTTFADYGINLSKLQSRPITGEPWKYRFYLVLDVAGSRLHQALSEIRPLTRSLTILGEYRHNI